MTTVTVLNQILEISCVVWQSFLNCLRIYEKVGKKDRKTLNSKYIINNHFLNGKSETGVAEIVQKPKTTIHHILYN